MTQDTRIKEFFRNTTLRIGKKPEKNPYSAEYPTVPLYSSMAAKVRAKSSSARSCCSGVEVEAKRMGYSQEHIEEKRHALEFWVIRKNRQGKRALAECNGNVHQSHEAVLPGSCSQHPVTIHPTPVDVAELEDLLGSTVRVRVLLQG